MVILGLGSNMGDRQGHLGAAVTRLSAILSGMAQSGVLESAALLPAGAPAEWDRPYLNMAVRGETQLAPAALLDAVKGIESDLGRIDRGVWGPREIDIDILAMDDAVIDTPQLSVPHRELLKRDFALLPLAELAPHWRYPVAGPHFGKQASELAAGLGVTLHG